MFGDNVPNDETIFNTFWRTTGYQLWESLDDGRCPLCRTEVKEGHFVVYNIGNYFIELYKVNRYIPYFITKLETHIPMENSIQPNDILLHHPRISCNYCCQTLHDDNDRNDSKDNPNEE